MHNMNQHLIRRELVGKYGSRISTPNQVKTLVTEGSELIPDEIIYNVCILMKIFDNNTIKACIYGTTAEQLDKDILSLHKQNYRCISSPDLFGPGLTTGITVQSSLNDGKTAENGKRTLWYYNDDDNYIFEVWAGKEFLRISRNNGKLTINAMEGWKNVTFDDTEFESIDDGSRDYLNCIARFKFINLGNGASKLNMPVPE